MSLSMLLEKRQASDYPISFKVKSIYKWFGGINAFSGRSDCTTDCNCHCHCQNCKVDCNCDCNVDCFNCEDE